MYLVLSVDCPLFVDQWSSGVVTICQVGCTISLVPAAGTWVCGVWIRIRSCTWVQGAEEGQVVLVEGSEAGTWWNVQASLGPDAGFALLLAAPRTLLREGSIAEWAGHS